MTGPVRYERGFPGYSPNVQEFLARAKHRRSDVDLSQWLRQYVSTRLAKGEYADATLVPAAKPPVAGYCDACYGLHLPGEACRELDPELQRRRDALLGFARENHRVCLRGIVMDYFSRMILQPTDRPSDEWWSIHSCVHPRGGPFKSSEEGAGEYLANVIRFAAANGSLDLAERYLWSRPESAWLHAEQEQGSQG